MRKTLLGRFLPGYIAVVLAALVVTVIGSAIALRNAGRNHSLEDIRTTAALLSTTVAAVAESERLAVLESASGREPRYEMRITRTDSVESSLPERLRPWPQPLPDSDVYRTVGRGVVVYATDPLGGDDSVLVVSRELTGRETGITRVLASIAIGGLVLALGLYLFLRGYTIAVNQPVERMRVAARRYADGDLSFDWDPRAPPEIEGLAEDLHRMAVGMRERLAAISAQRNQLETILSSMIEGVVVLDENRLIDSMNAAAGNLLGVEHDAGRGKTLLQYVRIAELDTIADAARESREPVERTVTLYRDHAVHLQVHATRLGADEAPFEGGVLLVLNNISRIKELEKVRSDFVANVSHELKTPVTSIKGFVETLLDEPDLSTEQAGRFLGIVLRHTNRLNSILEDLLSLSRIEQNDQQIDIMPCSVTSIVDTAIELCRAKAVAKGITVHRSVTGSASILANPSLLEQAMVNLIDNALKYSDRNSEVRVSAINEESLLRLSVEDQGHGIRRQDLARVFERFYRTDKARSRELGGTGLGLAIVKHIAILHDGEVGVESTVGVGSTFTITIPQAEEPVAAAT